MANYFYKKDKRVLRVDDDLSADRKKELIQKGYIQVKDRRNLEPISKPKKKRKVPKKAKLGRK